MNKIDLARSALYALDAGVPRDQWVKIAMSVKAAGLGLDDFTAWSATGLNFDSEADCTDVWRSIDPTGGVTAATLFAEARKVGWHEPGNGTVYQRPMNGHANTSRSLTDADSEERAARKARQHEEAAKNAKALWKNARPAGADHPYLIRKGVQPVDTLRELPAIEIEKIIGYPPRSGGELLTGRLLLAPVKNGGKLWTVEMIDEKGRKAALYGGAKAGGYWATGSLPENDGAGSCILIGEGVATVLSAWQATGHPGVAALSAGNLESVARTIRALYPAAKLVVLADLLKGDGKPDPRAVAAARAVGAALAVPDFGPDRTSNQTDFNDMATACGVELVGAVIRTAIDAHATTASSSLVTSRPLPPDLQPVPPFPMDALPDAFRPWVSDVAARMNCPPDFVAVPMLVAAASLVARRVAIRPQAKADWTERANLWALIVGRPGVMKSPALAAALEPINRLEARAAEAFRAEQDRHRTDAMVAKLRAEACKTGALKRLKEDPSADVSALLHSAEEPESPVRGRYVVGDATYEKLGEILSGNPDGVLAVRDEIRGLFLNLAREESASARAFYLQAWSGGPYVFDRIGRGTQTIPDARLSVIGGIQPGPLSELIQQARRGAADDGMLERFLVAWPDSTGPWRDVDRWPDTPARQRAFDAFDRLDALSPESMKAERDIGADGRQRGMPFLRFSDAAREAFVEWRTELEQRVRAADDAHGLEGALSKFRHHVPAMALTLHAIDGGTGPVTETAVLRALMLADYFEAHARRLYDSGRGIALRAARAILAKHKTGALVNPFSARDIYRNQWSGLADRNVVADALDVLIDHGLLTESTPDTGGRSSTIYCVEGVPNE